MNCEQCEDQLLDLLYGELPAQQATLVQSHAEDCQTCLAALDELKDAMGYANAFSFDEPPASFDTVIMEAARSHVLREDRIARMEQTDTSTTEANAHLPFLSWLRGLMTGPQFVATAAMIAIVGVSIWALRKQTLQGDTAMSSEPSPMQAPAVEAVEMEADLADKFEEQKPSAEDLFKETADLPGEAEQDPAKVSARREGTRALRVRRARTAERKSIPMRKSDDPLAGIRGGSDFGASSESSSRGYAPSASSNMAKGGAESAPAAAEPMRQAPYEDADETKSDDETRVVTSAYNRGINLYEARKYAEAARAFEQALSSRDARRSDTLFYLARSYRERGDCARAINPYQAFLRENPKDTRARTAQRELSDCRTRIDKSSSSKAKRSKPAADVNPSAL